MDSEHYCLRWNNHQNNLLYVFEKLLREEKLVDVTLACEGEKLKAHKIVLAACSTYFQQLFTDHPDTHPIVILKDVRFVDLRTLLEFMYKGEVNVEYKELSNLLHTAHTLRVKGLVDMDRASMSMSPSVQCLRPESPMAQPLALDTPKRSLSPPPPQQQQQKPVPMATDPHDSPLSSDSEIEHNDREGSNPHQMPNEPPGGLTSPHSDPKPGPSGLMPVQQAPLSLKKEMEWGDRSSTSDEKCSPTGGSPEFKHFEQDCEEGGEKQGGKPYLSGASYSHQNMLRRHMLSHSLDSLKFRGGEPFNLFPPHPMEASSSLSLDPHHFRIASKAKLQQQQPSLFQPAELPAASASPPAPPARAANDAATAEGVTCKFCGQAFPDVAALVSHLPAHTGDRPFKCSFCGKAFKLRHHMKDHCRVHTGERPFRCDLCGKNFSRSTILKAHEKTHYPKYMRKSWPLSPGREGRQQPEQQRLSSPTQAAPRPPS